MVSPEALLVATDHHVPILVPHLSRKPARLPTFRNLVDALVARFHDLNAQHDSNVTRVFDKGNDCEDNIAAVHSRSYHMIGSLVPTQHADLLAMPAYRFKPLAEIRDIQWQLRRWQKGIITKGWHPTLAGGAAQG